MRSSSALAVALSIVMSAGAAAQTIVLEGATVIDGTGGPTIEEAVIVTDGARIACVGTAADCDIPGDAERVGALGRYVTPGLVDAHVHFSQTGWLDGRPDGVPLPELYPYDETARALRENPGRWHRSYLCSGITAVFDVGGHPWTTALPERAEHDPMAAHVRAAGPLVTHAGRSALDVDEEIYTFLPLGSIEDAEASIATLMGMGAQAVKVWYLQPNAEMREVLDARLMAVGRAARKVGLPLIVHATALREAKTALRAGAKMLVHSVDDRLVDEEFLSLLRDHDAVYVPTLVVAGNWRRAMAHAALSTEPDIDDPNGCVDPALKGRIAEVDRIADFLPDRLKDADGHFARLIAVGAARARMKENLRRVHAAGVTVATGTDAGNPLTLHGPSILWEMEAMQAAGIPPADVIVMSTRNGAIAMGRSADFGTLEAGKIADLLVLNSDPREDIAAFRALSHVMRAGVLHERASLAW